MGSDIILCMALIASFAFVIQFLLSILGSDLDTDIDIDSASDLSMSLSDIISFKGITHFILGYSWTTYFSGSHLVGVVIGSFLFFVLFFELIHLIGWDVCPRLHAVQQDGVA